MHCTAITEIVTICQSCQVTEYVQPEMVTSIDIGHKGTALSL